MFRVSFLSLAALLALAACSNNMKSRDKVQQAILNRLQEHSGLDLKNLDVNTTAVTFDKNMAYATVFFHPKGDPKLDGGMTMKYTLTSKDGKWVVVNVADSQGHGISGNPRGGSPGSSTDLPPGHPPLDSGNPSSSPAPAR